MKTNKKHESKREEFDIICERLAVKEELKENAAIQQIKCKMMVEALFYNAFNIKDPAKFVSRLTSKELYQAKSATTILQGIYRKYADPDPKDINDYA